MAKGYRSLFSFIDKNMYMAFISKYLHSGVLLNHVVKKENKASFNSVLVVVVLTSLSFLQKRGEACVKLTQLRKCIPRVAGICCQPESKSWVRTDFRLKVQENVIKSLGWRVLSTYCLVFCHFLWKYFTELRY